MSTTPATAPHPSRAPDREWPPAPPLRPDPELVGHSEGDQRAIREGREHAQRTLADADRQDEQ
jgi:hypothetical protein